MSEQRGHEEEEEEVKGEEEVEVEGEEKVEVEEEEQEEEEKGGDEGGGEDEENTQPSPKLGGSTAEQPPEDYGEPGSPGEEMAAGELQTVGEAGADLQDDAEQLREPQTRENVGSSTATVKVVLVPEGHVMTVAFAIGLSIQDLKRHLASELRVPAETLQISLDGRQVEEQQTLMELGVRPHGSTRLEMSSTDPSAPPLRPLRPPEHDDMPDVITVRVQTDEGDFQEVVVEIERPRQQKVFLGGYRHQLTGAEYHNAAVQTAAKRRPDRGVLVFSRDTQTAELKSQAQQCSADAATQMAGIGHYVSCVNDKLVVPGNYVTADEYHDRRLRAAIRLQSSARRWLARQKVEQLRRERDRRLAWLEMQERKRREEKEEQLRDRRRRWMSPKRREDFNLLYHALEKWRSEEEQRINSSLRGTERKAALCVLLDQETQLIATIGRHRIAVQSSNYDRAVRKFLDKCAAPHQWRAADGRLIEMESQQTIRAAELRDLYNSVSLSAESQEQRLQVLQTLKHTVQEHPCQLTRDIVDLVDREVDLLTRGVEAEYLEGLRKRISTLLLQFIKTPAFNPEVAKLLRVPQDPSQLKSDMLLCRGCNRYLLSADFSPAAAAAAARPSARCRGCATLGNVARSRDDDSCFKSILRRLRADELRINEDAKIPFLLQAEDMRYLVKVVWAARSALSASSDLYDLVFVRWDRHSEWSPWNCILLSKEETATHMEVEDVYKVYEDTFIRQIKHKHTLARRHFSQISVMAEHMDSQRAAALGNQLVSKKIKN